MKKFMTLVLALICVLGMVGCNANKETDNNVGNWTVGVDSNVVEKIDIYWNYQSYCIERSDNPSEIENLITFINGEYAAIENIVRIGTGSGNEITIYDSKGNELFWFSVWELKDEMFGLGNSEYKFAKVNEQIHIDDFIELLPT